MLATSAQYRGQSRICFIIDGDYFIINETCTTPLAKTLAKSVLVPLGLTTAASATDAVT